jgi:hypothetical protein
MAIRNFFVYSLLAAGAACGGFATSAKAQSGINQKPAPLGSGGLVLQDNIPLAPGETIIAGPPELMQQSKSLPAPVSAHQGGVPVGGACLNDCFAGCEPGYFLNTEALFMQRRGDSGFTRSTSRFIDELDYEWGGRFTLGRRFDCVNGYEFTYTGLLEWENPVVSAPGTGPHDSLFISDIAPNDVNLAGLNNAFLHAQRFRASYDSIEFNRTYNGWDVARTYLGFRTILYDESYELGAFDAGNDLVGGYRQSVENVLIGPQVGLDLYYPVSNRFYAGAKFKGGVFLNIADSTTQLFGGLPAIAGNAADEEEIAGVLEVSSQLGYHLARNAKATIGYDVWYMAGVATSYDQVPFTVGRNTGRTINVDGDVLIHGLTAGIEISF